MFFMMSSAMETNKDNTKSIVVIKDLKKSFGENCVLDGFNLELFQGENLVVMGKSGSGKSVMIKCLIGLEEPDEGSIEVMGKDIKKLSREALDELRTEVGFLFQGSALYDSMSVRENLEFPLRRHTKKFGIIQDTTPLVMEALESVGLASTIDLMPNELSGGMKRRLMIAKALSHEPTILFLDEPTAGVDVSLRKDMWELVRELKDTGVTVILTTHYIEEAEEMADRIGIIRKGELILVEEKLSLMKKLGKKELTLQLQHPLDAIPEALNIPGLTLSGDKSELIYTFDLNSEQIGIAELLQTLSKLGLGFKDLHTKQSSLEEIFVNLVNEEAHTHAA